MTEKRTEDTNSQDSPPLTRVGAYVRVSSEDQVDTWSLDSQQRAIQEFCERNPGYRIVEKYVEEGHSAWKDKADIRPQYLRMMSDAKAGKLDLVVSTAIDRMSRSNRNMIETFEALSKSKVGYKSLAEDLDFRGPYGELMLSVFASVAQLHSSQISANVRSALQERVRSGLGIGRPPYGYQLCDESCQGAEGSHGYCHVQQEKAAIVLDVYERYASGTFAYGELADMLNKEGHRTNGLSADRQNEDIRGHRFTTGSISRMLRKPFYKGSVEIRGKFYPGTQEPIVSEELFERVQNQREKKRRFDGRRSERGHMLAKLVMCCECGNLFHATLQGTQEGNTYLRMAGKATGPVCRYTGRSFVASKLDEDINELFRGFQLRDNWRDYILTRFMQKTNVEELQRRRASLLGKKDRTNDLYIDGEIERRERDARVSLIHEELAKTEVFKGDAVEKAGELLEDFGSLWESANLKERNRLLRTVLQAIYVDFERREIVSILPTPAFAGPLRAMEERSDLNLVEAPEPPFSRELSPSPRKSKQDFRFSTV